MNEHPGRKLPIVVDRSRANVYVNTGHYVLGVKGGPVSGRELMSVIACGKPAELLAPFSPARFSRRSQ